MSLVNTCHITDQLIYIYICTISEYNCMHTENDILDTIKHIYKSIYYVCIYIYIYIY